MKPTERKQRALSLFQELIDLLIPDEQIDAVTPENTMPDPPKRDPVQQPWDDPPKTTVPEKLQRLADMAPTNLCPSCGDIWIKDKSGNCETCGYPAQ